MELVLEKERPDALLPTLGGQTALNVSVELAESGALDKYGVELIGAKLPAIQKAEDRALFKEAMVKIGLEVPQSGIAHTVQEALALIEQIGFPAIIRPAFTSRRHRRRYRLQYRRIREDGHSGACSQPNQ